MKHVVYRPITVLWSNPQILRRLQIQPVWQHLDPTRNNRLDRSRLTLNYFSLHVSDLNNDGRFFWHSKKTVFLLFESVASFSTSLWLTIPAKLRRSGQCNAALTSSVIIAVSASATAIMLARSAGPSACPVSNIARFSFICCHYGPCFSTGSRPQIRQCETAYDD